MDSFQKIKQKALEMIAEQQCQIYEAPLAKQSNQMLGEMMSKLTGIQMVYNAILEIEGKPAIE